MVSLHSRPNDMTKVKYNKLHGRHKSETPEYIMGGFQTIREMSGGDFY